MLSRLAESLYWTGRYVERAEDTARILDVYTSLLLDDPWAPEGVVCASLLAAMGHEVDGPVDTTDVMEKLAWDASRPSSVIGSIAAARENARTSREVVSTEMWESINVTWHESASPGRRANTHAFLSWVRERAAAFNGTADGTLSRDEAYQFLVLGRAIERVDMTARLVAARALAGDVGPSWITLLQSCGAYSAFLRSAQGSVGDTEAIEFLLLDPLFPRTLMSQLTRAVACLSELAGLSGGIAGLRQNDAHRALGAIRSELEFSPTAELIEDIYPLMERVQEACSAADDAISGRYFPRGLVTAWQAS